MQTGLDVLHTTDWDRTFHAYGVSGDAPGRLSGLLADDPDTLTRSLDYLYSAMLHQGTLYPATVPTVLFVAGLLERPDTGRPHPEAGAGREPLRAALLGFLRDTAESAAIPGTDAELAERARLSPSERDRVLGAIRADDEQVWEEPALEALTWQAVVDLRAAAPVLRDAVQPLLTCPDALLRSRAVEAAAAVAALGGLDLDLSGAADMAETRDEAAVIVLAKGEAGGDTSEFLTHADPAIRACAALAPALSGDPRATRVLVEALEDPREADQWFGNRPAAFGGHVRFTLVRTLAERAGPEDAARLLPVHRRMAALSSAYTAEADCGPLLDLAFSRAPGNGAPHEPTAVQKAYLRALLDNDDIWAGTVANFSVRLKALGLPMDREGVQELVDA
ncbi:hypothetical protein [Nocardiopsis sp. NRRL B-16309]|uniref:hypothetical protein n=1 Tax=Nocardiopsis sp. NRRL B-16309 TaxID=1519494 RepID=UPI0006AF3AB1|nr:hypothetical protein [Nocardiopsis sp. NRRL B-16309]KOX15409.1 hypothetical protein ADL05_15625 [Nocardiopsis sp. NRRL B-16309]